MPWKHLRMTSVHVCLFAAWCCCNAALITVSEFLTLYRVLHQQAQRFAFRSPLLTSLQHSLVHHHHASDPCISLHYAAISAVFLLPLPLQPAFSTLLVHGGYFHKDFLPQTTNEQKLFFFLQNSVHYTIFFIIINKTIMTPTTNQLHHLNILSHVCGSSNVESHGSQKILHKNRSQERFLFNANGCSEVWITKGSKRAQKKNNNNEMDAEQEATNGPDRHTTFLIICFSVIHPLATCHDKKSNVYFGSLSFMHRHERNILRLR